jgi:hypothetical protein
VFGGLTGILPVIIAFGNVEETYMVPGVEELMFFGY